MQPPAAVSSSRQLPPFSSFTPLLPPPRESLRFSVTSSPRPFSSLVLLSVCLSTLGGPASSHRCRLALHTHSNGSCGSASEEEVSRRANSASDGRAPPPKRDVTLRAAFDDGRYEQTASKVQAGESHSYQTMVNKYDTKSCRRRVLQKHPGCFYLRVPLKYNYGLSAV